MRVRRKRNLGILGMPRESNLYTRWSLEMRRLGVFSPGERIGVAVSGGPDSVLLLHFMNQLAGEAGFCPSVVHFNHHLRGAESDKDERFVAEAAEQFKIEFLHAGADVARVAREGKKNLEATARELRYRFFFSLIRQGKADRVATAHTANDQAETVLLRLLRGAGTRGLGGIYPALGGKVVRPFLSISRAEIEKELDRRHLSFRVDPSNLDARFTRNRIRQQLVPLLEKQFNPEIVSILAQLADRARDDERYLEQQAAEIARPWRIHEGHRERIPTRALTQFPPSLQRRVLRQMVAACAGPVDLPAFHIELMRRFASTAQSGKALTLSAGIEACKEFDWLVIQPRRLEPTPPSFSISFSPPAEVPIPGGLLKVRYEIVENPGREALKRPYNTNQGACLDFDKLRGGFILRNWREGDRFSLPGARNPRKLKELFIARKIPAERRRLWPVLTSGDEIVWARGFPTPDDVAVSPSTHRILIIEEDMHEIAAKVTS